MSEPIGLAAKSAALLRDCYLARRQHQPLSSSSVKPKSLFSHARAKANTRRASRLLSNPNRPCPRGVRDSADNEDLTAQTIRRHRRRLKSELRSGSASLSGSSSGSPSRSRALAIGLRRRGMPSRNASNSRNATGSCSEKLPLGMVGNKRSVSPVSSDSDSDCTVLASSCGRKSIRLGPSHSGAAATSAAAAAAWRGASDAGQDQNGQTESTTSAVTRSSPGIFLQLQTYELTPEQILNEIRGIYAGLVMVERMCQQYDEEQANSPHQPSHEQWRALISMHRTLLNEHHDFFLASQQPSAWPELKRLPETHDMPARMWRIGIHSLLDVLWHRLPESLEHMLSFISLAYSMMALFLESVPAFEDMWIECLGDLARYRMAIEDNLRGRAAWARVARYWYFKMADRDHYVGRVQHHLAVLARPDILQQLFYYTKALVSVDPFPMATDTIVMLFHSAAPQLSDQPFAKTAFVAAHEHLFMQGPFPGLRANAQNYFATPQPFNYPPVASAFVTVHAYLFMRGPFPGLKENVQELFDDLDNYIGLLGRAFMMHGAFMASSNFAAICQFGFPNSIVAGEFKEQLSRPEPSPQEIYQFASENWPSVEDLDTIETEFTAYKDSQSLTETIYYAVHFTFQTLSVILDHLGNSNILPSVHCYLVFLWCMARNRTSIRHIEVAVPWGKLACFLNTLLDEGIDTPLIEADEIPVPEDRIQMPEDFVMRGQLWCKQYYPPNFFENAPTDDDGRSIETPSMHITRSYRCMWLGYRLAKFNRWTTFDSAAERFEATPFALNLEKMARRLDPFGIRTMARM